MDEKVLSDQELEQMLLKLIREIAERSDTPLYILISHLENSLHDLYNVLLSRNVYNICKDTLDEKINNE